MAGCGCGGKRIEGSRATLRRSHRISQDVSGAYSSGSSVNCSGPYSGANPDQVIYMVAIGTENEQGFTRANRAQAIHVAATNEWTIDPLPARSLCHEVVVGVLGGDLAQPSVDA